MVALNSALYVGTLQHRRFSPAKNTFNYKMAMFFLDIDTIGDSLSHLKYCTYQGRGFLNFRVKDYLKNHPGNTIRQKLQKALANELTIIPDDKIYLLTQLRTGGVLFNPVSYYYIWHHDGRRSLIAEVTNTPWLESYCYVLTNPQKKGKYYHYHFKKTFHVSPFLSMNYHYQLKTMIEDKKIIVHMENWQDETLVFDATLDLKEQPLIQKTINRVIVKYPLLTWKIILLIYWQATKIYLKGNPFYSHP